MQLHSAIRPISWLKNNAKQMVETVDETGNPIIITQNGEAKAVVMNVRAYDKMQESLALLRILKEIQVTPYRIIYQINKDAHAIHIHVVADGRRNFTELLKDRLLNVKQ